MWTARHNFSHNARIAQLAVNGGATLPSSKSRYMALNTSDDEAFSYSELWPCLAAWAKCGDWEGPAGRNGLSVACALGKSVDLLELWKQVAEKHGLQETCLREVFNVCFFE